MMLAVDPDELAHEESIVDAEVQLSIEPGGGSGPGELADADKTVEVRDSRDFLAPAGQEVMRAVVAVRYGPRGDLALFQSSHGQGGQVAGRGAGEQWRQPHGPAPGPRHCQTRGPSWPRRAQ